MEGLSGAWRSGEGAAQPTTHMHVKIRHAIVWMANFRAGVAVALKKIIIVPF
jgi:hypothetical protein